MKRTPLMHVLLALLLAAAAWAGCEDDGARRIRLVVDADPALREGVAGVTVSLAASRPEEGKFCSPVLRSFDLEGKARFPLVVYYVIGEQYDAWFAARVVYEGGDGRTLYGRETVRAITDLRNQEIRITYEPACEDRACPAGQQCVGGACEDIHQPSVFDDDTMIDAGTACQ
jgi:hypothetical protein